MIKKKQKQKTTDLKKSSLGGQGLFQYSPQAPLGPESSQGRKLEAAADAESLAYAAYWFASAGMFSLLLSYTLGQPPALRRQHPQWAGPFHINR